MAEKAATKKAAKKAPAKKTASRNSSTSMTPEERAAMKERAAELRKQKAGADGEKDLLEKVAAMPKADREIAEKLHALIRKTAPELTCRTWYGMPAYAKDGDVLCFFQDAAKFKARYAMLGFSDKANLDKGSMWPVYYALANWNGTVEKDVRAIIKQAVAD